MSNEFETDYRHVVDYKNKKVHLVKWEGEDKILLSLNFHKDMKKGFTMTSAIEEIDNCIAALTEE